MDVGERLARIAVSAINPLNEGRGTNHKGVTKAEYATILKNLTDTQYNYLAAKYLLDMNALHKFSTTWKTQVIAMAELNNWSKKVNPVSVARITLCEGLSPLTWSGSQRVKAMGLKGREGARLTRYKEALHELTVLHDEALDIVLRNL